MNMSAKEAAKKKLIKDLLVFVITAGLSLIAVVGVGWIGNVAGFREMILSEGVLIGILGTLIAPLILGLEIAGMVVGWKALRIRSGSLIGFIIKLAVAIMIGYVLFPIVIIKDIVAYVKA